LSAAPLAKAYLAGVQLPEAGLIWADLAWTKSTGAKFCETTMPDGTVNNRDCPPEPTPPSPSETPPVLN
jgi:hypothetical protein